MKIVVLVSRELLFFISAVIYTWFFFIFIISFLQSDADDFPFDLQKEYGPLGGLGLAIGLSWWLSNNIVSIAIYKNYAKWMLSILVWLGAINLLVGIWLAPFELLKDKLGLAIMLSIYGIVIALFSTIAVHTDKKN